MTNTELFDLWRARAVEDPDLLTELDGIRGDADAINDRFYRDLAFGTGGLRGVIGAGSNRMNIYTIRRATQGLADYINAAGLPKKVAIGHDSRHKGELFSREAARVLAANGIIPGIPQVRTKCRASWSRSPRSSAMSSSLGEAVWRSWSSSRPGPGSQCPSLALLAPAGMDQ